MTTDGAGFLFESAGERVSVDELLRRKGVRPIQSADDLACDGVFDTDEELDAFLAHVAATRLALPRVGIHGTSSPRH